MGKKSKPSLKAQIEEVSAPEDSRLVQIIRDNQETELLEAEELHDEWSYPLWLRVWWRKQHPEVQIPATNPGAAYPEVLSQLYKRMKANPELPWGDSEKIADAIKNQAGEARDKSRSSGPNE